MYIVGLTGGIASGKSTVDAMLKDLGAYIIDTDRAAHEIVMPNQPAWYEVVDHFGSGIMLSDGSINRKVLAEIIFRNPAERLQLEKITHPYIEAQVAAGVEKAERFGHKFVVIDIPLLFEVGWQQKVDEIWVIYVNAEVQLARLKNRNQLTEQQAMDRICAQMEIEEKIKQADVVIDNTFDVENTKKQVVTEWDKLCRKVKNLPESEV
jgi:dephospho-CoA kinase